MDFPLITTGLPPIPFREKVELLPQIYPEASPPDWAAQRQPVFIKNVTSIDLAPYIDLELQDNMDQIHPLSDSHPWLDFPLRSAMNLYFKVADEMQRKKQLIDLYV
jgi:hypothetical protein